MEYRVGTVGRVVAMRLSEGDDLYESVEGVAKKEDIRSAAVFIPYFDADRLHDYLGLASRLRGGGFDVECYPDPKKKTRWQR